MAKTGRATLYLFSGVIFQHGHVLDVEVAGGDDASEMFLPSSLRNTMAFGSSECLPQRCRWQQLGRWSLSQGFKGGSSHAVKSSCENRKEDEQHTYLGKNGDELVAFNNDK
jgi:hypothetical protein